MGGPSGGSTGGGGGGVGPAGKKKDGTYGTCDMCDESIAIGRLRAKPFAKFCTPCREIYEVEK